MAVKYFDLIDYYKTNFNLIKQLNISIFDLDNMLFWERELYVRLLIDFNEEQQQLQKERELQQQWQ